MLGTLYINPGSKKGHSDHVSSALSVMRKQEKFSDLQFVCKDDSCSTSARIISAHQSIFAQCSVMLKSLFSIARSKQPFDNVAISLDTVNASLMEKLIEYVYEGKTTIDHTQRHDLANLCKLLQLELPLQRIEMPNGASDINSRLLNGTVAEVELNNTAFNTTIQTLNSSVSTILPVDIFPQNEPVSGIYSNSTSTPIPYKQNQKPKSTQQNAFMDNWKNSYVNLVQEIKQEPLIENAFSITATQSHFKRPRHTVPLKESTSSEQIQSTPTVTGQFQCPLCEKKFDKERDYALHNSDAHLPNITLQSNDNNNGLSGITKATNQVQSSSDDKNSTSDSNSNTQIIEKSNQHLSKTAFKPLDGCARTRIYVGKGELPTNPKMNDSKRQNMTEASVIAPKRSINILKRLSDINAEGAYWKIVDILR